MKRTALVTGVTGQDGAYLSRYLLERGYRVVGTSRTGRACDTSRLEKLDISDDVEIIALNAVDFNEVQEALTRIKPDEIYHLAGQSSVGRSFDHPVECFASISTATLNMLEALRKLELPARLFGAGSSECFGDTDGQPSNESTKFQPRSPYAAAKCSAFWQVAVYRQAYGLFCCTGMLGNHESPLRPGHFVTQKIVQGVKAIQSGQQQELKLGNLDIWRDWGWAPDYVEAMHAMLQTDEAKDYLIASGNTISLLELVKLAFEHAGLNHEDYLISDSSFIRPSDLRCSPLDPSQIATDLGWRSRTSASEIIERMMTNRLG